MPNKMKAMYCKTDLVKIFMESVNSVNPARLVAEYFKVCQDKLIVCDKPYDIGLGNVYLIGFGKAVLGMAAQCEKILGKHLARGVICIPDGLRNRLRGNKDFLLKTDSVIQVFEGAKNNLPDENAEKGAEAILNLVSSLSNVNDKLIVLISGGGSALFPKAVAGISLKEKLDTIACLTSSGADITELNTVRKKLSEVKGGGLANLSYPFQTIGLILSDVLNDPLDIIASGPTVPNLDESSAAFMIIKKYNLMNMIPRSVLGIIQQFETKGKAITAGQNCSHVDNYLIGNNIRALHTGQEFGEQMGYPTFILSHEVNGSVNYVANFYKDFLSHIIKYSENSNNNKLEKGLDDLHKMHSFHWNENFITMMLKLQTVENRIKSFCTIAGGETTVKLQGKGKGGRNQELALLMLAKLNELKKEHFRFFERYNVMFLSSGTDGIDGPTDVAGAVVDCSVLSKVTEKNLSIEEYLLKNDSYNFFMKINNGSCFVKTGHTGTNVADIHILAVCEREFHNIEE